VIFQALLGRGASFFRDLVKASGVDESDVAAGLGELASTGLVTSDGFGGVRALVRAAARRRVPRQALAVAGRWLRVPAVGDLDREAAVETQARALLRRYGVIFRKIVAREAAAAPWRELSRACRRLEARGEIRGGRFVTGVSGEQFALPEAVERLRETRRTAANHRTTVISAVDPLNLTGLVTTGDRVRAVASARILYRGGTPVAALEGGVVRPLASEGEALTPDETSALAGRRVPAITSGYIGRAS
jgi:ATP-dependent Lhr-like helicase